VRGQSLRPGAIRGTAVPSSGRLSGYRDRPLGPERRVVETPAALAAIRAAYIREFNVGNVDAVMGLHTAATIHLPSGRPPIVGQTDVRDLMLESLRSAPGGFRFHFEPVGLRLGGDLAVEWGVTPGAAGFPGGKYIMVYERDRDGCWRIAWTMSNLDGPSG